MFSKLSASHFSIVAGLLLTGLVGSCQSAKKTSPAVTATGVPKAVVPTAPPIEASKGLIARPVTSVGDNRAARFSPDGSKLLFVSSLRPSHKHAQVYELDLLRMTERRITFHDGDDEGASWDTASRIVYSSLTDELKEDVSLDHIKSVYEAARTTTATPNGMMRPPPKSGGEIYRQRLDGRAIERLTNISGPDISPTAGNSARIVFVSSRSGKPQLYLLDSRSDSPRLISQGPDAAPSFSWDGKSLVWERAGEIFMSDDLREASPVTAGSASAGASASASAGQNSVATPAPAAVSGTASGAPATAPPTPAPESKNAAAPKAPAKTTATLTAGLATVRNVHPSWSAKDSGILFSSNRAGKHFDIYWTDKKGSCVKRLTEVQSKDSAADLWWPVSSPDGSKIAFTMKAGNQNQVFVMEDRTASLPCMPAAASIKSE